MRTAITLLALIITGLVLLVVKPDVGGWMIGGIGIFLLVAIIKGINMERSVR